MGRHTGRMQKSMGRAAMRSPGAPSLRREVERQFWKQIATGITSDKAAEAVCVSQPVGTRYFRHRGGMPLFMSKPVSARYLSFAEQEEIALLRARDIGVREIARLIGRSPSTVSRELIRNASSSPTSARLPRRPAARHSRSVNTTERYDTGRAWMTSIPCKAVASKTSESPALTTTALAP